MTDYQSTFEPSFDFTKPMGLSADMSDHIDPSNLISSYQPSDIDWLSKDPFEILPWGFSSPDETFNPFAEGAGLVELEPQTSYSTSNHSSPTGYNGYTTIKTEDVLSEPSPLSDIESETWSPTHSNDNKSGSLSPIDVLGSDPSFLRQRENTSSTIRSNNINSRKVSNTSTSSPTTSSSPSSPLASPKSTVSTSKGSNSNKRSSTRSSTLSNDSSDVAAVMKRKKAAHNAIEKRYRTNMNAKFLALGNAIPRSGVFSGNTQLASNKGPRKQPLPHSRESISSLAGTTRQQEQQQQQNKSEILTNALSYIHELQDENSRLKSELLVLKENLLPRGNNMAWRR